MYQVGPKVITEQLLSQCLDEEKTIGEEIMDLYEGNDNNKLVKSYDNLVEEDIGDGKPFHSACCNFC